MTRFLMLFVLVHMILIACEPNIELPSDPIEKTADGEFLDDWTYNVFPTSNDNFEIAQFRLWLPEQLDNPKAVLILLNGSNSNGLYLARKEFWQSFAKNEKLAILSVYFRSKNGSIYTYAENGSGRTLIQALDTIATKNNIDLGKDVPILLRGFSAGGVFSYYFSAYQSKRVIGYANLRGGSIGFTSTINDQVPCLMIIGEKENWAKKQLERIVTTKRKRGGLYSIAIEPNAEHFSPTENADNLIKDFFSSLLQYRISDNNPQLIEIDEDTGWLGTPINNEIYSFDTYPYDKKQASWLVDNKFAKKWTHFQ